MVTVGVVIPAHPNHFHLLPEAIESAKGADQVVVVADGYSRDRSHLSLAGALVLQTYSIFPGGVSSARNLGISHLGTDLVIPLDADDYFLANGVERLRDAWIPGTFAYGHARVGGLTDRRVKRSAAPSLLRKKNVCQATMCFHRLDWLTVGGYDPRYNIGMEDWAFQLALAKGGIKPLQVDHCVYHYSDGGNRREFGENKRLIASMLRQDYGIEAPA